ncbi:MAG: tRNA pseudouridine(55) synthase TruB [Deltaproteobacteria bacterium]|nr:tRNA pseudouridine(55) synthase TruB [Deltaproteobacteria bacterium]
MALEGIDGLLLVNKPKDILTFDLVKRLKSVLKNKLAKTSFSGKLRVGHGGALDPFAEGLVVILSGTYVSTTNFFHTLSKKYIVDIKFGVLTDTFDICGKILREERVDIDITELEKVLQSFEGEIDQVPPSLSSVKVHGRPSYEYFYKGQALELPKRRVRVHEVKVIDQVSKDTVRIQVICGKGFYVRSFANDLAMALGCCGGIAVSLKRLSIGPFGLSRAFVYDDLDEEVMFETFRYYEPGFSVRTLTNGEHLKLLHGDRIFRSSLFDLARKSPDKVLLLIHDGRERGLIFFDHNPVLALL